MLRWLTIDDKARIVKIYYKNARHPKVFTNVSEQAKKENISVSSRHANRIVKRWKQEHRLTNNSSENQHKRFITDDGLVAINKALLDNNELTAIRIKEDLNLIASPRTILNYIQCCHHPIQQQ